MARAEHYSNARFLTSVQWASRVTLAVGTCSLAWSVTMKYDSGSHEVIWQVFGVVGTILMLVAFPLYIYARRLGGRALGSLDRLPTESQISRFTRQRRDRHRRC